MLDANGSNKVTHKKIPWSQVPSNFFYSPRFVQVGHRFWIFGGNSKMLSKEEWKDGLYAIIPQSQTLIWHINRHIYYPGPKLPKKTLGTGCPIGLNRNHVLILHLENDEKCIQGHIYSFEPFF